MKTIPSAAVRALACCALFSFVSAGPAAAAPGDLDPEFSTDGKVVVPVGPGQIAAAQDLVIQPDGRLVTLGSVGSAGATARNLLLARVLPDGTPDNGFGGDGVLEIDLGGDEQGRSLATTASGELVIGATRDSGMFVVQLTPTGELDPKFSEDGVTPLPVSEPARLHDLVIDAAGRITAVGGTSSTGAVDGVAVRLKQDGTLDATFGTNGVFRIDSDAPTAIQSAALDPVGRAVIGGEVNRDSNGRFVARLTDEGNLDQSFAQNGWFEESLFSGGPFGTGYDPVTVTVGPTGDIYVATVGRTTDYGAVYVTPGLKRIAQDGSETGSLSRPFEDDVRDLLVTPNGELLAAGRIDAFTSRAFAISRFAGDSLDPTFAGRDPDFRDLDLGMATIAFDGQPGVATGVELDHEGRIVLAGPVGEGIGFSRLRVDAGPPDLDADGLLDGPDRCELGFAPERADGCPRFPNRVTLRATPGPLKGQVKAANERCESQRKIVLIRDRPGPNQRSGSTKTTNHGEFRFSSNPLSPGRYRALARRTEYTDGTCAAVGSRVVQIASG